MKHLHRTPLLLAALASLALMGGCDRRADPSPPSTSTTLPSPPPASETVPGTAPGALPPASAASG